jgi:hypothetical protein
MQENEKPREKMGNLSTISTKLTTFMKGSQIWILKIS